MLLRAEGVDVWYADEKLAFIGPEEIAFLKEQAAASDRLRARICLHENIEAPVHEMVIAHHRSCYVRPHRHPFKHETLNVLDGSASAVFFDEAGAATGAYRLDAAGGVTMYRVPRNVWHSLVIESEWLIFYEVSPGPFFRGSSEFAPWSPEDNDPAATVFLEQLRARVPGGT